MHPDVAVDEDGRGAGVLQLGEDDEAKGLHGTAGVDHGTGLAQIPELGRGLDDRRVGRAVDHQAERALLAVLDHQYDRPREVGVEQGRLRDQELSARGEVHAHRRWSATPSPSPTITAPVARSRASRTRARRRTAPARDRSCA